MTIMKRYKLDPSRRPVYGFLGQVPESRTVRPLRSIVYA